MDIYSILSSKSDNFKLINSYLKFILRCEKSNLKRSLILEKHHICPKAKDMFPEYAVFKVYPWNCISLTQKQHIIAHLFLARIFKNLRGAYFPYILMSDKREEMYSSRNMTYIGSLTKYHSCKWCGKVVRGGNFTKHHGDNCKKNPDYICKNILCYNCGVSCDPINYARSHGENCKVITSGRKLNYIRSEELNNKARMARLDKKMSEETKDKLRGPKPRVKCPYCDRIGAISVMKRWHFTNCKNNELMALIL